MEKTAGADKYKDIIIDSMRFLVRDKGVIIYGFVIMPNHMHLVWQMQAGRQRDHVQRDFLKHTALEIKKDMRRTMPAELKNYLVNAKDRGTPVLGKKCAIV